MSNLLHQLVRDDVIKNPKLMGVWVEQNLRKNNLVRIEGCSLAIKEFGNNNPFSNGTIYNLECMQIYKDRRKQENGRSGAISHWKKEPTKEQLLKKIAKISKSELKQIVDESENSGRIFTETLHVLSKRY